MNARNGGEIRRESIVSSAQELILRNGYGYTTLDQVAERAEVSKGLISYYFPTKDALFLAVLEKILARLTEDLERCYRADVPARERLRLNFQNLFGSEKRTRQYYLVLVDFLAQASRDSAVRDYTDVIYETVLKFVEWTIIDGIRAGEFRPVGSGHMASLFVATMEGLVFQWLYNREGVSLEEGYAICEALADDLLAPSFGSERIFAETASGSQMKGG